MSTQTTTSEKLAKVMEQVQLLLARADHPTTPPAEADLARSRAEILMFRYKIDTVSQPEIATNEPSWSAFIVCETSSEWANFYSSIATLIAGHTSLRVRTKGEWKDDGTGTERRYYVAHMVGFESDVRYAEILMSSALMAFGKALEPKFDHGETHAQNALRLRRGGMERRRIALILFGTSETVNEQKAKNRKVTKLIKEEATRIGEPELADEVLGRGNSIKTFRESYASGFYSTLVHRLQRMAFERGQYSDGAVVLASLKERVDEAFYAKFPEMRPQPVGTKVLGEPQAECLKCKAAKSGFCREHSWKRPRAARQGAFSMSAYNSGSSAARKVDLGYTSRKQVEG